MPQSEHSLIYTDLKKWNTQLDKINVILKEKCHNSILKLYGNQELNSEFKYLFKLF